uniref:Chromosome segregation ATPase n=1 Tax=Acetithermum autotrophicum TaxID=1446466 RepID=H5SSL9_ACEAU|nr:chromosome segregation ATPase [Candidatus Acetothermum autotrophicum]
MKEAWLESWMDRVEAALARLAEAQARTEEHVTALAGRMDRVEAALERLAQAQARTEERVGRLEAAIARLTEAQARTDERLAQLTQAQARTDERLAQLAEAQARTDERLAQLAQAQARTDERLTRVEGILERTERVLAELTAQVKALSDNVGYGLEDIARVVLPGYLRYRYGIKIERFERRLFQIDGQPVDIDLYAEGTRGRKRIVVLGEAKARIYGREVSQFHSVVERLKPHIAAEVVPLMFGYFIDLSATEAAGKQTLLIASYQPTTEMQSLGSRRRRARQ